MERALKAGTAALLIILIFAASAGAELRTGSAAPRYPEPGKSSPTRPELRRADLRYDNTAGSLQVTLTLRDALADPAATSALRPWRLRVEIGDYLNGGVCTGALGRTWLAIGGTLGDDAPAVLDSAFDLNGAYPDSAVTKTFSPDRTQVLLSVTDAHLVGLNIICADAEVFDDRPSSRESSQTFAFLLDGFDAADGALSREVRDYLSSEADAVSVRLRPGHGGARSTVRCSRLYQTAFSCHGHARLEHVRGSATLSFRGRMEFDAAGARHLIGQRGWRADMRATVSWRRCPNTAARALRGKPCHITERWRGTRPLAEVLGV
jgi:hypothetical protein